MKLISFATAAAPERCGLWVNDAAYDLAFAPQQLGVTPYATMMELLRDGARGMATAQSVHEAALSARIDPVTDSSFRLLAPIPRPPSCRDGYAFRQHVATARRNRGAEMIPEFDQFPIFYFTNHLGIIGPGDVPVEEDHLQQLDFELEAAIVIGREGKNIDAKEADAYIAGYTIMNDFSARTLQMEEMKLSLGPAKGKDFATALGPWLVTTDELSHAYCATSFGAKHKLKMTARHNGTQVSDGNLGDMNWTFAEIIERASYGVTLYPGDVIGSGTVGSGCYMELNGTRALDAKAQGLSYAPVWLRDGDTIELAIEGLGRLTNTIRKAAISRSILAKKKNVR